MAPRTPPLAPPALQAAVLTFLDLAAGWDHDAPADQEARSEDERFLRKLVDQITRYALGAVVARRGGNRVTLGDIYSLRLHPPVANVLGQVTNGEIKDADAFAVVAHILRDGGLPATEEAIRKAVYERAEQKGETYRDLADWISGHKSKNEAARDLLKLLGLRSRSSTRVAQEVLEEIGAEGALVLRANARGRVPGAFAPLTYVMRCMNFDEARMREAIRVLVAPPAIEKDPADSSSLTPTTNTTPGAQHHRRRRRSKKIGRH